MTTEVTLERYAEMRAEIEAGALRDDVLRRFDIPSETWLEAQRTWLDRMGHELTRGRFELSNRYSQAFLEKQATLAKSAAPSTTAASSLPALPNAPAAPSDADSVSASNPSLAESPPSPSFMTAAPAESPPSPSFMTAAPAAPLPASREMPSFLRAPAQPTAPAPLVSAPSVPVEPPAPAPARLPLSSETLDARDLAAVIQQARAAQAGPLPFAPATKDSSPPPLAASGVGSPAPNNPAPTLPVGAAKPVSPAPRLALSGQTLDPEDLSAIVKKALPFAGKPGSTPAEPPGLSALPGPSAPPKEASSATTAFALPSKSAVPFAPKTTDQAAVENAKRHADAVQGPEKPGNAFSGETVAPFEVAALMKGVPLPFAGASGPKPPASPPASLLQAASPPQPASPPQQPPAPAQPASPPVPVRPFTLEQYASLCEDIAFSAGQTAEVLARYGLTDAERRALDDHWTTLFQKQPMTFLTWQSARSTYRAWSRKQRGT